MRKCRYFIPVKLEVQNNCINCQRWTGKRCRDEQLLREEYEDSRTFKFFDRLMRENKGVQGPL
jgi:hypothetical protein